jgi:hypothetical protein
MTSAMVKVLTFIPMDRNIQAISSKIANRDMANTCMLTETVMKGTGKMICTMGKAKSITTMVLIMKDFGQLIRKMDRAYLPPSKAKNTNKCGPKVLR